MALPGVFAPVDWEGRLLVDGGIIDNLPVAAAREMGAERLIAIDIGTPPLQPDEIQDLFGITSQMVALLTQRYVDDAIESLGPGDVLIQPQLGDLTSADFTRGAELIVHGHEHRCMTEELVGPRGPIPVRGISSGTYHHDKPERTARYRIYDIDGGRVVRDHVRVWDRETGRFAEQSSERIESPPPRESRVIPA